MERVEKKVTREKKLSPTEAFRANPLTISLDELVKAKGKGRKVRKASPFGLSIDEYLHAWSVDGRYFYCSEHAETVRDALKDVS